ncbi:hypothetical protein EV663_1328, partial [Rhodovulum bhavnagarense]
RLSLFFCLFGIICIISELRCFLWIYDIFGKKGLRAVIGIRKHPFTGGAEALAGLTWGC